MSRKFPDDLTASIALGPLSTNESVELFTEQLASRGCQLYLNDTDALLNM